MNVKINTEHLLDRIEERTNLGAGREEAENLANEWRDSVLQNAPEDWRFTMHPRARFFLTYIDANTQIKILGRSYRHTLRSSQLWTRLESAAASMTGVANQVMPKVQECARLYRRELADPKADICHELKTVYEPDWELEQERHWHPNDENSVPHTVLLYKSYTETHLAKRPNALLIRNDHGKLDLWVRQGNPYIRMTPNGRASESYCLFCRLVKQGLVHENGALWQFDTNGMAQYMGKATCSSQPVFSEGRPPEGFRSWNYWALPTLVDVRYRDIKERQRKGSRPFAYQQELIRLIEQMYQVVSDT